MEWRVFNVSSWHSGYIKVSSYTCAKKQLIYFTKNNNFKSTLFYTKRGKKQEVEFRMQK